MRRSRGFLLVLSLLLVTLMLIMGLAFLNRGANQYRSARQAKSAAQARALAWVGLEQTRAKLDKDLNFPPRLGDDQQFMSLEENVTDLDGSPLGSVIVVLERAYVEPPYYLLRVRSTGLALDAQNPAARCTLVAEFDLSPTVRGTTIPNPNLYDMVNLIDNSGF